MNEKAVEWAVEVPESAGYKFKRITFLLIAVIIFIFYTMTGNLFGLAGVIAFSGVSGWMQMNANVEYICYYFNEVLEITPLYNRTRHGKKLTFSIGDILYLVEGVEPQEITRYFCKKKDAENVYTLLVQQEDKQIAIVTEVEPDFVDIMQKRNKVRV